MGTSGPPGTLIAYKHLGNMTIEEFAQAVRTDLCVLRDVYNLKHVKGAKLRFIATDEEGNEVRLVRPGGRRGQNTTFLQSHYNRPVCEEYDL